MGEGDSVMSVGLTFFNYYFGFSEKRHDTKQWPSAMIIPEANNIGHSTQRV
jgi:hypothetical protein